MRENNWVRLERPSDRQPSNPLSALTPAQLAAIRAIILEVIDDGYYTLYEGDIPFNADEPTAHIEIANAQRLDFCDEIQAKIVAAGAPAAVRGASK